MISNTNPTAGAVLLEKLTEEDELSNKQLCVVELASGAKVPYYYPVDQIDIENMYIAFLELNQLIKKIYLSEEQYNILVSQFKERLKYTQAGGLL